MDFLHLPSLQDILILLPAIIIGLTFHEAAHGYTAYLLGDNTAKYQGRLTLNPIPHIDPLGMLLLFIVGFGWAKPVPVNPYNFHGDHRKGMLLVSLAGPVSNFTIALITSIILGILVGFGLFNPALLAILQQIIAINIVLAIFNLLPIPPLDGSKIFASLFPSKQGFIYQLETYGTVILLLLLFTGILGKLLRLIINPIVSSLYVLAANIASLIF